MFSSRLFSALAALLYLVAFLGHAPAADRRLRDVIAEFEVSPDGDFLRLPVTIRQKEYQFLVNTGLPTTTIDEALRTQLELPRKAVEAGGRPGGRARDRYRLSATLGTMLLEFPAGVESADYAAVREKLDLECRGEIGLDVLQQYVVQIDFDRGSLRFLSSLPASPGDAVRMTPLGGEGGAPTIPVALAGMRSEKFIVASARAGNALDIQSELLAQLEEKELVKMLDKEKGVTRVGSLQFPTGRLESLQIGKFRHEGLLVNAGEQNAVGVSYLARYLVTFDFPRSRLYLKKGAHFDDPDARLDFWQIEITREANKVVVQHVAPHGPAHRLGLRAGDVVESINGCDVRRISNWQVRRLFGRRGRALSAVVRRGAEQLTLEIPASSGDERISELKLPGAE